MSELQIKEIKAIANGLVGHCDFTHIELAKRLLSVMEDSLRLLGESAKTDSENMKLRKKVSDLEEQLRWRKLAAREAIVEILENKPVVVRDLDGNIIDEAK